MKFVLLTVLLTSSISAFSQCPTFKPHYVRCENSQRHYTTTEIIVRAQEPYFDFYFISKNAHTRLSLIANGEPHDVTIQNQEGDQTHYIQIATCTDKSIHLTRIVEDDVIKEEVTFTPHRGGLLVENRTNGILMNMTNCQ